MSKPESCASLTMLVYTILNIEALRSCRTVRDQIHPSYKYGCTLAAAPKIQTTEQRDERTKTKAAAIL